MNIKRFLIFLSITFLLWQGAQMAEISTLWGKYGKDLQNTYYTADSIYKNPQLKWERNDSVITGIMSPALSPDGSVLYYSSYQYLTALNAATGEVLWQFCDDLNDAVWMSPIVDSNGNIYVNNTVVSQQPHYTLYALHPDGTMIWKTDIILADYKTIYQNRLYSVKYTQSQTDTHLLNRTLVAINLDDGSVVWEFDPSLSADRLNYTCPAVFNDTIYVSFYSGKDPYNGCLYALDLNGNELWHVCSQDIASYSSLISSPVVDSNGNIYVVITRYEYNAPNEGKILKLDSNGNTVWVKDYTPTDMVAPTLTNNTLYVITDTGVAAYDTDGNVLWTFATDENGVEASPLVDGNGRILVMDAYSGTIYILNSDGSVYKQIDILANEGESPGGNPILDSDGTFYVSTSDGVFAFGYVPFKPFTRQFQRIRKSGVVSYG